MDNILCYSLYKNTCYINPTHNLTHNLDQIRQLLLFKEFLRIYHDVIFNEKPITSICVFLKQGQGS